MRKLPCFCLALLVSLFPICAVSGATNPVQQIGPDAIACTAGAPGLNEQGFVRIGGIEQWITIKGERCDNPVILFIHGGPGNPNTPYADTVYGGWEKDFTLVQWDQRGAGSTYVRNPRDPETTERELSIERMAADGNEVAAFLISHLKTKKLILFGGSWGSVLSVHMAKSRPELFAAYVATGQLVSYAENDPASYRKTIGLARTAGDAKTLSALEALGAPPWSNPRSVGILRRANRTYEAKTAVPAPKSWWEPAEAYATKQMLADFERGEDYSWLQFVGWKGDGMLSTLDLRKLGLDFKMPVFMVQGADDLVTVPEVAKRYFDEIAAPSKEYVLLPNTGHGPNQMMLDAQYRILKLKVLPLLR
ncbi:alpha/beta hydrolase [Oxalobacteraceae bacterium]|nr:alpha/beta hydrolase [Oxalobacteraceae bacterium]